MTKLDNEESLNSVFPPVVNLFSERGNTTFFLFSFLYTIVYAYVLETKGGLCSKQRRWTRQVRTVMDTVGIFIWKV